MSYNNQRGSSYGSQIRRGRRVQARRSGHAKAIDARASNSGFQRQTDTTWKALTKTNQRKTKSKGVTTEFFWNNKDDFDRLINKDDIKERNKANKKVLEQILKTLDENNIAYYDGGEDTGIQVQKKDMEKAEKLTDKLYMALKTTF